MTHCLLVNIILLLFLLLILTIVVILAPFLYFYRNYMNFLNWHNCQLIKIVGFKLFASTFHRITSQNLTVQLYSVQNVLCNMWPYLCTCYFLLLLRVCMRLVSLLRNDAANFNLMLYGFISHSPPTRWIIFVFKEPKMFPELLLVQPKDESCFAHIVSLAAGVNKKAQRRRRRCHHKTRANLFPPLSSFRLPLLSFSTPHWSSSSSSASPQFSAQCFSFFLWPGSKAAPRPGGIGSAAAGQPGMEGDSMLSKILPGGAAEQAGKLGEGTTATKTEVI